MGDTLEHESESTDESRKAEANFLRDELQKTRIATEEVEEKLRKTKAAIDEYELKQRKEKLVELAPQAAARISNSPRPASEMLAELAPRAAARLSNSPRPHEMS